MRRKVKTEIRISDIEYRKKPYIVHRIPNIGKNEVRSSKSEVR